MSNEEFKYSIKAVQNYYIVIPLPMLHVQQMLPLLMPFYVNTQHGAAFNLRSFNPLDHYNTIKLSRHQCSCHTIVQQHPHTNTFTHCQLAFFALASSLCYSLTNKFCVVALQNANTCTLRVYRHLLTIYITANATQTSKLQQLLVENSGHQLSSAPCRLS